MTFFGFYLKQYYDGSAVTFIVMFYFIFCKYFAITHLGEIVAININVSSNGNEQLIAFKTETKCSTNNNYFMAHDCRRLSKTVFLCCLFLYTANM